MLNVYRCECLLLNVFCVYLQCKACSPSIYSRGMRKTVWIWFVGCAAWIMDGVVQLHVHALLHARLAFTVAMLFLVAGLFYRNQKN